MFKWRRVRIRVAATLLIAAGPAAACDRSDHGPPVPRTGGTLKLIVSAKPAHLDPQRVTSVTEANLSRLVTRTLTTFRSEPGRAGEIVGDLATDTGRPSEGNRVWDFTLKSGLKWADGAPITCADVKYGVERGFSGLLQVAQPYARTYLAGTDGYAGPFVAGNNNGKGLASVLCVDQRNIRFTLSRPAGDFGQAVAMAVFAPVPARQDTKTDYDKRPVASGPYTVEENTGKQIVYGRNRHWEPGTDSVRRAYPDRIVLSVEPDLALTTANLIGSDGDWADSIHLDEDVAPNFVQQVINDPELSRRAATGDAVGIRYLAINSRTITSLDCRKALVYAFDRRTFRAALGGSVVGEYATSMIPPRVSGHRDVDLYGGAANPQGRPDEAARLLDGARAARKPCRASLTIAIPDRKDIRRPVNTMIETYRRLGIDLRIKAIDPNDYWDVVGNPDNGHDLIWAGWLPDWASGSAIIPPLFDGTLIPTKASATSNQNLALLNDPEINSLIDAALAEPGPERQATLWGELDEKIQVRAVTIPILYPKASRMTGVNVRGGFIHPRFGQPDVTVLGLAR